MKTQKQADMRIKWLNVTCDNSKHIIPAQKHLFKKYAGFEPTYLDVGNNPIDNWGKKVASMLPNDDLIIFGLDDYLPIDYLDNNKLIEATILINTENIERIELGWGASKKNGFIDKVCYVNQDDINGYKINYLEYGKDTPYKVSCQFSIWKTSALKRVLNNCTTPWNFEVKGICKAACFKEPAFRWIEESAISGRQKGKVNILGLKHSDVKELQNLGHLKDNLIYGWKGETQLPNNIKEDNKYGFNYF